MESSVMNTIRKYNPVCRLVSAHKEACAGLLDAVNEHKDDVIERMKRPNAPRTSAFDFIAQFRSQGHR